MAKKLLGSLKLQVPAGAANPSPPIGPALGQRGINIMEFCNPYCGADWLRSVTSTETPGPMVEEIAIFLT